MAKTVKITYTGKERRTTCVGIFEPGETKEVPVDMAEPFVRIPRLYEIKNMPKELQDIRDRTMRRDNPIPVVTQPVEDDGEGDGDENNNVPPIPDDHEFHGYTKDQLVMIIRRAGGTPGRKSTKDDMIKQAWELTYEPEETDESGEDE